MRHEFAKVILGGYTKCQLPEKSGIDESDAPTEAFGKVERIARHRREQEIVQEKRGGAGALDQVR